MACNQFCHYGPAPHICFHKIEGAVMGQSQLLDESDYPDSFEPDPEVDGLGIHHCCGWTITKGHPMTTPTQKFTKKPVTIEAVRFVELSRTQRTHGESVEYNSSEIASFMGCILNIRTVPGKTNEGRTYIEIPTLEGIMEANVGDWIIKGVKGEFYPCKPDIFEATYSPALAAQPELLEPVGEIKREGVVKVNFFESCTYGCALPDGTKLYTSAQLQQAVEQKEKATDEWQDVERLAVNRYRPVPDGFSYKVAGGDGTRSLWHGTQDECRLFAAKLTEAFLDGAFVQRQQAQAKREPMGDTDLARLFREIYGGTRFGESERLLARAIEAHHYIGDKA